MEGTQKKNRVIKTQRWNAYWNQKWFHPEKWTKETMEKLQQTNLLEFLRKNYGYNTKVTEAFVSNYHDKETIVEDVTIPIIKEYLSNATGLREIPQREGF